MLRDGKEGRGGNAGLAYAGHGPGPSERARVGVGVGSLSGESGDFGGELYDGLRTTVGGVGAARGVAAKGSSSSKSNGGSSSTRSCPSKGGVPPANGDTSSVESERRCTDIARWWSRESVYRAEA